jgi:hypothetical protein
LRKAVERRADQTSGAGHARNFVAGIAPIFANFGSTHASIAAAG